MEVEKLLPLNVIKITNCLCRLVRVSTDPICQSVSVPKLNVS